jgi:hypothetical protein
VALEEAVYAAGRASKLPRNQVRKRPRELPIVLTWKRSPGLHVDMVELRAIGPCEQRSVLAIPQQVDIADHATAPAASVPRSR